MRSASKALDCSHFGGVNFRRRLTLKVFTKSFVQGTVDLIKVFVEDIEKAVQARSAGP